mmetsp:Transcript_56155/g.105331  ORF Transcript_56155/g.105331 Transcript_56155/m.105331 type:complete len:160 (+) Transcript_56155:1682-2161(+)
MLKFDWKSAFWVNSAVAKQVYAGKDSAQGMVASTKQDFESWVAPLVNQIVADAQACFTQSSLQGKGGADCSKVLDALAVAAGGGATKRWIALWAKLMVTYADGMVASADASNELCGCAKTAVDLVLPTTPGPVTINQHVADVGSCVAPRKQTCARCPRP